MITEQTHDEYCATCTEIRATLYWWTLYRRRCVSTIVSASPSDKKCNTCGSRECRSPSGCSDTGQSVCHNCSCETRAVGKHASYRKRIGRIPTSGSPRSSLTIRSIPTTTRGTTVLNTSCTCRYEGPRYLAPFDSDCI